jgi:ferrous iron transport protein B
MTNSTEIIRVALAGNPNAGKTSIFNVLTGAHQKVGNYPGVTVEKLEGTIEHKSRIIHIVDLPGIYSLTAYSLDEVVTRDFVLLEKPDIVVDVLDSTNLERNLFLCMQFQELGLPLVAALNMTDEAEQRGISIRIDLLAATLGIPLVKTVGTSGKGREALLDAILDAADHGTSGKMPTYGYEIESKLEPLKVALEADSNFSHRFPIRWFAIKLLENDSAALERLKNHVNAEAIRKQSTEYREWIGKHFGKDPEIAMSEQRYGYIHGAIAEAVKIAPTNKQPISESIDKVLMNQFVGLPVFFIIIWAIFKLTFALGDYPMAFLNSFFGILSSSITSALPAGYLRSFLTDGIIAGVGGVFSFVPLIVILFFFLSILEDTGYMSRAAFLTDKFLHAFGLHGQSFMPLMLGFGCSVPAIMATRTLKSPRDRIATILAIPFMSCGGKLPVYVLLAGTFFPKNAGNVVMILYLVGVVLAFLSTIFLRKTVLRGATTPFVMELPPYRMPTFRGILWHVWEKTWNYAKKAGTVILAASILIWAITNFPAPKNEAQYTAGQRSSIAANQPGIPDALLAKEVATNLARYRLENSLAGRIGKAIGPAIAPLGFNWKIGVALIPAFTAKELVVSTLGILYGADGGEQATGAAGAAGRQGATASLSDALRADPSMNPLEALVVMLFILVMPPCFASLATIRSEAGNKWLLFQVAYSIGLAWILAFAARSIGLLIGF